MEASTGPIRTIPRGYKLRVRQGLSRESRLRDEITHGCIERMDPSLNDESHNVEVIQIALLDNLQVFPCSFAAERSIRHLGKWSSDSDETQMLNKTSEES